MSYSEALLFSSHRPTFGAILRVLPSRLDPPFEAVEGERSAPLHHGQLLSGCKAHLFPGHPGMGKQPTSRGKPSPRTARFGPHDWSTLPVAWRGKFGQQKKQVTCPHRSIEVNVSNTLRPEVSVQTGSILNGKERVVVQRLRIRAPHVKT